MQSVHDIMTTLCHQKVMSLSITIKVTIISQQAVMNAHAKLLQRMLINMIFRAITG